MSTRQIEQKKLVEENKALRQILGEMVYLVGGYKYEVSKMKGKKSENINILNKSTEAMFTDLGIASVDANTPNEVIQPK